MPRHWFDEARVLIREIAPEAVGVAIVESPAAAADCLAFATFDGNPQITFVAQLTRETEFRAVLIHELAHIVTVGFNPPPRKLKPALVAGAGGGPETAMPKTRVTARHPAGLQHGRAFTRAALHLYCRAVAAGWRVDLEQVGIAGIYYGLSPARAYLSDLGREPGECAGKPFEEILTMPLPESFSERWRYDLDQWETRRA